MKFVKNGSKALLAVFTFITLFGITVTAGTPASGTLFAQTTNEAPSISLNGSAFVEITTCQTYVEAGATATDLEDGTIANVVISGDVDESTPGTYVVRYSVTDSNGNTASRSREIVVTECVVNTAPSISLNGANPLNLTVCQDFSEPGFSATDTEDGDITADVVVSGSVNDDAAGTYTLTYTVTDSDGATATVFRTVEVADANCNGGGGNTNTAPSITLNGSNPLNLTVCQTFVEPGFTATDTEDGDITASVSVAGSVDDNAVGTYTLSYSVVDSDGASATVFREVVVADANCNGGGGNTNTAPSISLNGANPLNLTVCQDFSEPGFSATDTEDGDITADVVVSGSVNDDAAGTYTLTYTVTDSDGATATVFRTVEVADANCNGGGGNGGGGNGGPGAGSTPRVDRDGDNDRDRDRDDDDEPEGRVEGAAVCPIWLNDFLRVDFNNNPVEVMKLQVFLNIFEGFNLEVNGVFDNATLAAVHTFQKRYNDEILNPWGYADDQSTGFVYILTTNKINEIFCDKIIALTPAELEEIANYRASFGQSGPVGVYRPKVGSPDDYPLKDIIGQDDDSTATSTDVNGDGVIDENDIDLEGDEDVLGTEERYRGLQGLAAGVYGALDGVVDFIFSVGFLVLLLVLLVIWLLTEWYKGHNERKGTGK